MKTKLIGIFICTLLIVTTIPVIGQVNNISIIKGKGEINPLSNGNTWMRTFGGADSDSVYDGHQTSDGGYIVVGYTRSFGAGGSDVWLIKIDSYGNKEWGKTFGSTNNDSGSAVKQTNDGGYIIAGHYGNGRHVWLIKTNDLGELQWERTYFSGGAYDICQTDDEGYIVVGGYGDNLLKVDKDGNEMWNKPIEEVNYAYLISVQQTNDGGFIIIGGHYLIKTDSNGDVEWITTFDPGMKGQDVLQTSDGGYTVVGYKGDWFYPTGWMVRTDEDGNILGQTDYSGFNTYYGLNSLYQTSDGGYIITGRSHFMEPVIFISLWLAKTDEYGKIQWQKRFFGSFSPYDYGLAVQQTSDGGYFVVGSMSRGTIPQRDVWLIKTDANGNVPRNRAMTNLLLLRFLEQYFPLLQKILCYIL